MPERMLAYRFFAKHYGWTPPQVREELSDDEYEWLPKIEQAVDRAQGIKQRQAERDARAKARRM